jgi:hypothetical protein
MYSGNPIAGLGQAQKGGRVKYVLKEDIIRKYFCGQRLYLHCGPNNEMK